MKREVPDITAEDKKRILKKFYRSKLRKKEEVTGQVDNSDSTIARELGLKTDQVTRFVTNHLNKKYKNWGEETVVPEKVEAPVYREEDFPYIKFMLEQGYTTTDVLKKLNFKKHEQIGAIVKKVTGINLKTYKKELLKEFNNAV